jgi:hypothetical protein
MSETKNRTLQYSHKWSILRMEDFGKRNVMRWQCTLKRMENSCIIGNGRLREWKAARKITENSNILVNCRSYDWKIPISLVNEL